MVGVLAHEGAVDVAYRIALAIWEIMRSARSLGRRKGALQ